MKGESKTFAGILCMVLFFLAVCRALPVSAGLNENRIIRVAFPIQKGLTEIDEDGNYSGYTYEYLEEIAQYTGWNYEFVQVPGDTEEQMEALKQMVQSGEVDLMGAALYSEKMGKAYHYCPNSYGTMETVLRVLDRDTYSMMDSIASPRNMRIAVRSKTGSLARELKEYCTMNRITPELIECAGEEEMIGLLEDGSADALLDTSLNYFEGLVSIAHFSPRPFYFVTAPGDKTGLADEMNEAIFSITQTDPHFQENLHEKYFSPPAQKLALSDEETAYIKEAGELKVGVLNSQPPFQYRDGKYGELRGIGVDLLRHISEKTGLTFTMVEASSKEEMTDLAENGKIDLEAGTIYDYTSARKQGLAMTRPYISSQYILLMNENMSEANIQGKRLALPKTSTYQGYFVGKVAGYDTVDDCIAAVNNGRADYTYVDSYTAQYYINLPEYDSMKMVPQTYESHKMCFGIVRSGNYQLLGILNKAILTIPQEELQTIIFSNTVPTRKLSIGRFVQKYSVQIIFAVAGVFLLICLLLLTILRQRVKAGKAIGLELQKHLRVYAITNDHFFEYDYKKESLMLSIPSREAGHQASIIHFSQENHVNSEKEKKSWDVFTGALRSRDSGVCELYLLCTDGKWHWIRITMETICEASGLPVYVIGKVNIIDEEKNEKEGLREKAQRDSLTHIYNSETSRELIKERLRQLQKGQMGALLLLDVDRFKMINDTYGHLRGDEILREVAGLLQSSFRSDDIIGRPGGDEFLVYMTAVKDRDSLIKKCEALIQEARRIRLDAEKNLTVSMGAAIALAGQEYSTLFKSADQALYLVKESGKDCFNIQWTDLGEEQPD